MWDDELNGMGLGPGWMCDNELSGAHALLVTLGGFPLVGCGTLF